MVAGGGHQELTGIIDPVITGLKVADPTITTNLTTDR